jgi:hypothetical protein
MTELFKYPTINSLARALTQEQVEHSSFEKFNDRAKKQKEAIQRRRNQLRKTENNE